MSTHFDMEIVLYDQSTRTFDWSAGRGRLPYGGWHAHDDCQANHVSQRVEQSILQKAHDAMPYTNKQVHP